ncbi:MAG: MBL fold metallo-hydrolase [Deltaproteobacteria bacterium]
MTGLRLRSLHNPGAPAALRFGDLELLAFSISGVSSYVLAPAYGACFDLGHCPVEAARLQHVFLTHVHQDHALGVFRHHALRAMFGTRPARVYAPAESVPALREAFEAFMRLEQRPDGGSLPELVPVRPGDDIPLSSRRVVRAFDVEHRIASRGYTVLETRRELLPAWAHATPEARHDARERGETIHATERVATLTYIGDHTLDALEQHPEIGASEVLFLEATHLPGTARGVSARWGHTHLEDLVDLMRRAPDTFASRHIVLKHFSTRYQRSEIRAALERIPEGIRERVTMLV